MTDAALPEEGTPAPDFTAPRDGGASVSLSELAGRWVVLFFYPKDDTPGCTTEALEFTAEADAFEAAGATVIGISKDGVAKHEKFRDKHGLGIALVSDEEAGIAERYGVWKEKKMYGKTFMGIERTTFLIAPDGRIARVWPKVKPAGHAAQVLDALAELRAAS